MGSDIIGIEHGSRYNVAARVNRRQGISIIGDGKCKVAGYCRSVYRVSIPIVILRQAGRIDDDIGGVGNDGDLSKAVIHIEIVGDKGAGDDQVLPNRIPGDHADGINGNLSYGVSRQDEDISFVENDHRPAVGMLINIFVVYQGRGRAAANGGCAVDQGTVIDQGRSRAKSHDRSLPVNEGRRPYRGDGVDQCRG